MLPNQYPVGKFNAPDKFNQVDFDKHLQIIKSLPDKLEKLLAQFSDNDLDKPYREGGWTIRELVNHIADSHANAFIRFRLALTENNPTIKPYLQDAWVKLQDVQSTPIQYPLMIITGSHARMFNMLTGLSEQALQRTYFHPEQNKNVPIFVAVAMYAWHSEHHYTQIFNCKK